MAIRIDLLPRYVGLRRWFKRIAVICALLVFSFATVLYLIYYSGQLYLQKLKTDRDNLVSIAQETDNAEAAAVAADTEAKPLQDTANFFVDAGRSGAERAALLDLIRRYVYEGAVVGSLDLSDGQTAKFTAMVRTPDEYARFLKNLRRGTVPAGVLFADLPVGTGILGWPNRSGANTNQAGGQPGGQPGGQVRGQPGTTQPAGETGAAPGTTISYQVFPNNITAEARLREPVLVPTPPGEAAAPAPGGAGPGGSGRYGGPGGPGGSGRPGGP